MPYVNLKIAGSLSKDQKKQITEQFTNTLEEVTGKPKSYTYIVIEEMGHENWAIGGNLLA